jgi:hypothetical protein
MNPYAPPGVPGGPQWPGQGAAYGCARCGAPGADFFPAGRPPMTNYPLRARRYNRHVWIAFGISCLLWIGMFALSAARGR